jgi:hypothetical protein
MKAFQVKFESGLFSAQESNQTFKRLEQVETNGFFTLLKDEVGGFWIKQKLLMPKINMHGTLSSVRYLKAN